MATNRDVVTRLRSTADQKERWTDAAVRSEAPTLSAWIRATLDAEAASTSQSYVEAAVEHKRRSVVALTAEYLAHPLTGEERVEFEMEPILSPLRNVMPPREFPAVSAAAVEREFRGPDPKPTSKPKESRRR